MKKLSKNSFAALKQQYPVLLENELTGVVGGGSGTSSSPYTSYEMDAMMDAGTWKGGHVSGFGFVMGGATIYGTYTYGSPTSYGTPSWMTDPLVKAGAAEIGNAISPGLGYGFSVTQAIDDSRAFTNGSMSVDVLISKLILSGFATAVGTGGNAIFGLYGVLAEKGAQKLSEFNTAVERYFSYPGNILNSNGYPFQ